MTVLILKEVYLRWLLEELVDKQLTESAVDLIGVPGSADGEILVLQYDLGLG